MLLLAFLYHSESHHTAYLPIGNVPETLGGMGTALQQVTAIYRKVALDQKAGEPGKEYG